ncbi:hypothetical protein PIB30_091837 [Stylosanthes scabra]|uniref:Uncharacterized protein n=1 Tax=Stylosanthes scabra TaxID=79078 RepID=A0ABU6TVD2_9FABA|nr:hypothetical protein [Stylosanthes scabra]
MPRTRTDSPTTILKKPVFIRKRETRINLVATPWAERYGELTWSVFIANPTDPELALDNHRSYFPGGPFFPAPIEGRWVRMYSHRRRFSNGNGNLRRPETSLVSSGDKNCDDNGLLHRRRRESSRTRAELRRQRRVLGGGVAAAINKNSNNALSLSMHLSPLLSNLSTTTTTDGRSSVNGDGEVTARNSGCGEG